MSQKRILPEDEYFYQHSEEEIWSRYCGFLDLSVNEFLAIQERLLTEQIELVHNSTLGRKIMGERKPASVEEFRQSVPLTTYSDYEPYLTEQREDALAEKPYAWMHTSGRGGRFKWIPWTSRALDVCSRFLLTCFVLGAAGRRGEVNLQPGQRALLLLAPKPYISGTAFDYLCNQRFSLEVIPPLDLVESMEFRDRVSLGFKLALRHGCDHIVAISSILAKMGEAMATQTSNMKMSSAMLHPAVIARLVRGLVSARRRGRAMLPTDLWQAKSILTSGTDTRIYLKDITRYWGQEPWEAYAATETYLIACQSWTKKGLTFVPGVAFWEFLPDAERRKGLEDPTYQPKTVLLNEVEPGQDYEVVISHLYGMPLLRYRMGDIVRVVGTSDDEAGINLPQFVFRHRVSDVIQLASLTELDEKTIWQAIVNTGVKVVDWSANKEYEDGRACVRIFVEPQAPIDAHELEQSIDRELRELDLDYRDIGDELGQQPVRVTLLSKGTFERYYQEMRAEGADMAQLKPPHVNPPEAVVGKLLRLGIDSGSAGDRLTNSKAAPVQVRRRR